MKTLIRPVILAGAWFALAALLPAQTAPRPASPLRFNITNVSDSRSTNMSTCSLDLNIFGDAADDAMSVIRVRVTKALDELDRDLTMTDNSSTSFGFLESGRRTQALRTQLRLRSPSRNSGTIKLVEGEIDLFSPTIANGGKITLPRISSQTSAPVQHPAFQKLGIEVVFLTREAYDARVQQMQTSQNGTALDQFGAGFAELFRGLMSSPMGGDPKNTAYIYIKDAGNRVVSCDLADSQSSAIRTRSRSSRGGVVTGMLQQINLEAPLPEDAQLNVYLSVPEAVKTFPLKLENVALP